MGRPGLSLDRKFKRLARALDDVQAGFGEMLARGALELLWDSAYEACDDFVGDVDDVEAQAHWRGKRGTLTTALAEAGGEGRCGFIEEGGTEWWPEGKPGTYRIHDLWDHAPEYAGKRAAREAEREARGTTLSEIRSAAGKRGRKTQLERKAANGGQAAPFAEQPADNRPANGEQADAVCLGDAGKQWANGGTPAPTPTPSPTPDDNAAAAAPGILSKAQHLAKYYRATQALLDALNDAGVPMGHATDATTRTKVEKVVEQLALPDAMAAVRAGYAIKGKLFIGWYLDELTAAARAAARPPNPTSIDETWLEPLPEEARTEWRAFVDGRLQAFWPDRRAAELAGLKADLIERFNGQTHGTTT